jgi:lipopolysaccharide/colanic/teichoic acid biosynthesis glycosyltransferase/glycosyltransferase involved in cell wall biosynthesis
LRRFIDVFGSGALLLLTSPLFLLTALAIRLTEHGDVFYRQTRLGSRGRPFELVKFRSMRVNNLPFDDVTEIREGHPLVTPVGKWIRRFKIDELPQMLNVLRGDMALLGPRPGVPEHLVNYTAFQRRRLSIRPGLTGWAQVNGGIELTWAERIMLDVWYVDHRSFWIDLMILWQTAAVIFFGEKRNARALQEATAYAAQQRGGSEAGLPTRPATGSRKAPVPCRAVHLTSVHQPFDVRIFHKECKSLAVAGYDVTLIAPRAEGDSFRDGVKIRAVTPPRNRVERMTSTIWKVYQAAVQENGDIYHFHDPELIPVGALLKMRGKQVIYDVHEDFALDMKTKPYLPVLLRRPASLAVRASEVTFTRAFDRVIVAVPAFVRKFPAAKTRLVRNLPWTHEFASSKAVPYEKREPIAVFMGALADIRGLREMRQAVELAAKEIPIKLVIAGKVNPGAKADFQHDGQSSLVEYKGLLGRSQVSELLARARVGLVIYHPTENYVNALPHKLFEYMSAGLPVVASDFAHWRRIFEPAECGLLVNPLDPAAVAEALVWLMRHPAEAAQMGLNGQRAVAEKYNWELESKSLLDTYAELQSG